MLASKSVAVAHKKHKMHEIKKDETAEEVPS